MGLFDMLGIGGTPEERETRNLKSLQKKLSEKFGPPENRQAAIEELGQLKSTGAVEVLLNRFTFRVDPGITDDEEKHRVLDLIVDAEEKALPALKKFIATRDEGDAASILRYEKTLSNLQEVTARSGRVIAIATEGDEQIRELVEHVIHIPPAPELLSPLLEIVPLQLLAYHLAVKLGCDVDKPRNLAKSVTVE